MFIRAIFCTIRPVFDELKIVKLRGLLKLLYREYYIFTQMGSILNSTFQMIRFNLKETAQILLKCDTKTHLSNLSYTEKSLDRIPPTPD